MTVSARRVRAVRERDGFRCMAEGQGCTRFTALTIQHRINRGMGGARGLDRFANLVTLCATCNVRLEQDAEWAEIGRERGWKLYRWEDPLRVAVWVSWAREWRLLDDVGDWVPASGRDPGEVLDPSVLEVLTGGWSAGAMR